MLVAVWTAAGLRVCSAPSISAVTAQSDHVGLYEKFEASFAVDTVAQNPYWPYDESPNPGVPVGVGVTVDGLFTNDNWQTTVVQPAFYYQDYETSTDPNGNIRQADGTRTWLYPAGSPGWRVRFAPTKLGEWKYKIRVTDASGTATSGEYAFVCEPSSNHGFVKVSPTDKRYFELSDGTYVPFVGIEYDDHEVATLERDYALLESMGVNLVRCWWQSSSYHCPFFGTAGQGGDNIWSGLIYDSTYVRPGKLVSAKLPKCQYSFQCLLQRAPVKPRTNYRVSAIVKTVGVRGGPDCGVYIDVWPNGASAGRLAGDTDWTEITYDFTTQRDQYLQTVHIWLADTTEGEAYCSEVSLRERMADGSLGPELLIRPDFQAHTSYPQRIAYLIDRQLETAKLHGIYVKAVIEEKSDKFFSRIQSDGTWGSASDGNVYANPGHACRTLQSYYWRYVIARWGYSTALHSIELVNEGDPFNDAHREAAHALSEFVKANDPNAHLVSTSNWHSFPPPFWRDSALDFADLHMYLGWSVASGGNRIWPGWDGTWTQLTPYGIDDLGNTFEFDRSVAHSGSVSLKMTLPPDSGAPWPTHSHLRFQVGLVRGHRYRVSAWVKAQNCPGRNETPTEQYRDRPGLLLGFSKSGGDYAGLPSCGDLRAPLGTYDWQPVSVEFDVTSDDTAILEVTPRHWSNSASLTSENGYFWIDDIVVEDVTTGLVLNYNGGFEKLDSESYDVVAGHCAYSRLTRSFSYGKPTVRGETGICHPLRFTDPYKGFQFKGEDQLLVDDTDGVWWKKWVWAQTDAGGLYEIYWWPHILMARKYTYAKAYQDFMRDIPLSNGHYVDAAAAVTNPVLRVLGQKDAVNGRAHLWIDNRRHTWKNVVDGVAVEPVSGQVMLDGLPDGPYKVEWWDTSAGRVIRTEEVECAQGRITLSVSDLTSDIACKIAPTPPSIALKVTVMDGRIVPGAEVTIAVDYTNTGAREARSAAVTSRVPAEMDYVAGSAEATGGTYDPAAGTVTWIVESVPPGGGGRKIYKATVK